MGNETFYGDGLSKGQGNYPSKAVRSLWPLMFSSILLLILIPFHFADGLSKWFLQELFLGIKFAYPA